ncbi:MAG: EAL domain-containing protein [Lachnospiraceae bacterium]|nr:EAL domain-containing protein [Lachnospiraceae bacterium]
MNLHEPWTGSTFNVAAFLITVSSIFYTVLRGRTVRKQNKLFLGILIVTMLSALSTVGSIFASEFSDYSFAARMVLYDMEYLYFAAHTLLGPLMFYYALMICDAAEDLGKRARRLLLLPGIAAEILALLNPLHKSVYFFDETSQFQRGPLEVFLYLMAAFYALSSAYILLRYWRTTSLDRKVAVLCFYGLTAFGMYVQMVTVEVRVELLAEALSLMGLMFSVENEDHRLDRMTGLYNREALYEDLERYVGRKRPFRILTLRLMDVLTLQRIMGYNAFDAVPVQCANFLKTIHPWIYIYRAAPGTFVLLVPAELENKTELKERIVTRFSHSFSFGSFDGLLRYYLLSARVPEEISTLSDLLMMADLPIPVSVPSHILEGENLAFLFRNSELEKAVRKAEEGKNISLCYEEIYSLEEKQAVSREARLVLEDETIGTIEQEELLVVARQCNRMEELGKFLIREAFRSFSKAKEGGEGPAHLHVNLFLALLSDSDHRSFLRGLLEQESLEAAEITLEIAESSVSEYPGDIGRAMRELSEMGFTLALDNYGSGYSNMQEMFALPFDEVKLSGDLLGGVGENEVSDAVLDSNIRMIREMGMGLLAEGVRTGEQARILKGLGVELIQGSFHDENGEVGLCMM